MILRFARWKSSYWHGDVDLRVVYRLELACGYFVLLVYTGAAGTCVSACVPGFPCARVAVWAFACFSARVCVRRCDNACECARAHAQTRAAGGGQWCMFACVCNARFSCVHSLCCEPLLLLLVARRNRHWVFSTIGCRHCKVRALRLLRIRLGDVRRTVR